MNIFVHRASECLTDHLPHGEGLICYTLLKGLAERGHRISAYTDVDGVGKSVPGLTIVSGRSKLPFHSLAPWEHANHAKRWLRHMKRRETFDLVWHMAPCGGGGKSCPAVPATDGLPLVVGPLYYDWPINEPTLAGRPRLGFGIGKLLKPFADAGWQRTLKAASLVFCATEPHASQLQQGLLGRVISAPLIVDIPPGLQQTRSYYCTNRALRLVFAANLLPNKHPHIFCDLIAQLSARKIPVTGIMLGDGPERAALEAKARASGIEALIHFAGRVPNSEVFHHLAASDVLISASIGEPYGRSIVEAMGVGTVPICHRSGGPVDIISDKVDGFLVDVLEAAAYAEVIESLYAAPIILQDASDAARARASSWTPETVIDQVEKSLIQVLKEQRK